MSIIAPKTITAVDTGTDQLTIAAHGLVTGDPLVGVFSPDGGSLPAPLVSTSDYWVIRDDANTIRLADSSANAMAGTAIDLTTSGSGTLQLIQGPPYRRPIIAVPLAQLKTAHINATWESLQAIWNLLTGQAQSVWSGIKLAANQHVELSGTGMYKHGDRTQSIPIYAPNYEASVDGLAIPLPQNPAQRIWSYAPPAGTRLKSMVVTLIGNGTVDASLTLSWIAAGGPTTIQALNPANVPATAGGTEYTLNAGLLPYTLAAGQHFTLMISGVSEAAPALKLLAIRAVIDVP